MQDLVKITSLLLLSISLSAQPYFDAVTLRGAISPDAGLWRRNNIPVKYNQYVAGVSVPFLIKKGSSKIIFSAYSEYWDINAAAIWDLPNAFQGLLLPVTYIKPLSKKWVLSSTIIPRWNGNAINMFKNSFQIGGAVIASYKKTTALTYRLGIYYNSEFFGTFLIPLLGFDWELSGKDNLFGLLPQILTYEHKVSNRFYWGAVYRMYNSSYRIGYHNLNATFMRINESQLMLSADVYLTKNIVFNMEAGHSIFRRIRLGEDVAKRNYYSDEKVNDGYVIKTGLLYRVRLR